MRAWLTFLVAAVVATAAVSVYVVRQAPAGAASGADAGDGTATPPDDAGLVDVPRSRTIPPVTPTVVDDGVLPPEETAADEAPDDAPPVNESDDVPFGTLPEGDDGAPPPTNGGGGDEATAKKSEAPRKPPTWTQEWTRNFKDGPLVIPVDVVFGYAQLNLTVVFTPKGVSSAAVGPGEVQLTWTDAPTPKITCRVPVPLTAPSQCGPHTTPATEGAWEVTFVGSGDVEAKVTLSAWVEP